MPIDKKYFNTFVIIFAIVGAIILMVTTIWFSNNQQEEFRSKIISNDSLATQRVPLRYEQQQLSLGDSSATTVLLFWNAWVDAAIASGDSLKSWMQKQNQPVRLLVAPMHTPEDSIRRHWNNVVSNIQLIDGRALFESLHVPGVPATIWIDSTGMVYHAQVGYLTIPN
jgi:hypothetical protein